MNNLHSIQRMRRLRKTEKMRDLFQETHLSLNDLCLPIFVEEGLDDYKQIDSMPGVVRIPEKRLAYEIERIAKAGIKSVMTFGVSHHLMKQGVMLGKKMALSHVCLVSVKRQYLK